MSSVENELGKQGKVVPNPADAVADVGGVRALRLDVAIPDTVATPHAVATRQADLPAWEIGGGVTGTPMAPRCPPLASRAGT